MKPRILIAPLAVLAALALIGYPLYAHCGKCAADGKTIATQLDQTKFTLAMAVTAAEQHSKGRAISVVSELSDKDELMLHVWCITGASTDTSKIMKCFVDTKSGAVKGMKEVHDFPIAQANHPHGENHEGHGDGAHGDDHASAKTITNQAVEAGCGMCIYKMPGVKGCHLAALIDGKPYLVQGAEWPNHDFCDRKVQAVVTGKLEGDKFIVTSLEPKN
jgi:hypothetical protein